MDLCRLCYSCTFPELRQNIFNEKFDPPLWGIIADFSNLEIRKDDPYPKMVCVHCFVELKNFYTFRQMILNTDYRIRQNPLDVQCSTDRNDCTEIVLGKTSLSNAECISTLQNTDNHNNEPNGNNKLINNQNSITIQIKEEISIEETEQSNENLNGSSCPTNKINLDDILKEGIEGNPLQIARNDKIENNSDSTTSSTQKLTNHSNRNGSGTNSDKKLSQINGFVKNTEGIVDYSSMANKIVLKKPIGKDCENQNDSITGEACHEKFPQQNRVTHIKSVNSNQKFYKCEICKKKFLTVHQLSSHIGSQTGLKLHRQIEKSKRRNHKANNIKALSNHQNSVYIEKQNCRNDENTDTTKRTIIDQNHIEAHPQSDEQSQAISSINIPHQCATCGKIFASSRNLRRHLQTHISGVQMLCDKCGKQFSSPSGLRHHLKVHTGEKSYNCNTCGKTYRYDYELKIHQRIHTNERVYQCDICGKKFTTNRTLKLHVFFHKGEKRHQCYICEKKFLRWQQLKNHLTVHTGEQPYSCSTCGKKFSRQDNLKKHSRIHTGEKPFQCNTCNRRFLYKHVLRDHLKVHTGEKSCNYNRCDVQKSDLSIHMKQEHKKK